MIEALQKMNPQCNFEKLIEKLYITNQARSTSKLLAPKKKVYSSVSKNTLPKNFGVSEPTWGQIFEKYDQANFNPSNGV